MRCHSAAWHEIVQLLIELCTCGMHSVLQELLCSVCTWYLCISYPFQLMPEVFINQ